MTINEEVANTSQNNVGANLPDGNYGPFVQAQLSEGISDELVNDTLEDNDPITNPIIEDNEIIDNNSGDDTENQGNGNTENNGNGQGGGNNVSTRI